VVGIDEDEEKIGLLRQGVSPFYEPELPKLIQEGMSSGNLRFEVRAYDAVAEAEVVFICVGTPARVSGEANLVAIGERLSGMLIRVRGGSLSRAALHHRAPIRRGAPDEHVIVPGGSDPEAR
jgi:UDP-glucose 6-dehydrogenase